MTHRAGGSRRLSTGALARVEGEGAMHIDIRDGELVDVQLNIYEPPRFFEGFLRGRGLEEPVDITARICGICPVAYQMSACAAIEDALGITVDGPLRALRHLLYCGEWIESHTLHIHMLHAPDFLGVDSVIEMAQDHRPEVERGLEIKKIGNEVLSLLGGRAIHPINVRVGGFYRVPTVAELQPLRERLLRGRDLAEEAVDWVAGFSFADLDIDHEFVAAQHPTDYPFLAERIESDGGVDIAVADFPDHFEEHQVPHSTALHARHLGHAEASTDDADDATDAAAVRFEPGNYLVGPLARYSLFSERLSAGARAAADRAGLGPTCRNPFQSIVVRAVEVLHAYETAIKLVDGYERPDLAAVPYDVRPGTGHGVTEAPRGLLYHRYQIDENGLLSDAVIVPPTSQNQATIEHDLWHFVEANLDLDDESLRRQAEVTIRNHDPCISCATHFLDLTVSRT
ncbi:MAG: Ni/Fe hydrogenase subunit alpha [Acidimicrobiales bacterium]|nr:Ni/Fe hydrogenase subunit alpha [Acidimicrobiales bacterium]